MTCQLSLGVAKRIRVLVLPDLPPKGDVVDWANAGGTREQLDALVEQAQDWKAPGGSGEQQTTEDEEAKAKAKSREDELLNALAGMQGLDYERLSRSIIERLTPAAEGNEVPMRSLRRLQLRRHARSLPRGFHARRSADLPARENELFDVATALIEAAKRWYARSACHDPIVQANLARLAVLR